MRTAVMSGNLKRAMRALPYDKDRGAWFGDRVTLKAAGPNDSQLFLMYIAKGGTFIARIGASTEQDGTIAVDMHALKDYVALLDDKTRIDLSLGRTKEHTFKSTYNRKDTITTWPAKDALFVDDGFSRAAFYEKWGEPDCPVIEIPGGEYTPVAKPTGYVKILSNKLRKPDVARSQDGTYRLSDGIVDMWYTPTQQEQQNNEPIKDAVLTIRATRAQLRRIPAKCAMHIAPHNLAIRYSTLSPDISEEIALLGKNQACTVHDTTRPIAELDWKSSGMTGSVLTFKGAIAKGSPTQLVTLQVARTGQIYLDGQPTRGTVSITWGYPHEYQQDLTRIALPAGPHGGYWAASRRDAFAYHCPTHKCILYMDSDVAYHKEHGHGTPHKDAYDQLADVTRRDLAAFKLSQYIQPGGPAIELPGSTVYQYAAPIGPEPAPVYQYAEPIGPQPDVQAFTVEARGGWTWVSFPDRPSFEVRCALKDHGFRWSPKHVAWYRHDQYSVNGWLSSHYEAAAIPAAA